jgi:hypothetical protein
MSLHLRDKLKSYTVCLFYGVEQGSCHAMFRRMWVFYGRKDKRGTPCQVKISSKISQEMSNYLKQIKNNLLILSSIDDLPCCGLKFI